MNNREFRFTKRSIEVLIPAPFGKRLEYRDAEVKGLCLRINNKGAITFSVFKRVKNGPIQRITIGCHPSVSIEQARNRALEHISRLSSGVSVAQDRKKKRAEMTFHVLFNLYYQEHSIPNKITYREDQQKYDKYVKRPIGNKRLSEIERADIASMHSKITSNGQRPTANRVLALVSSVFGWAIDRGYYDHNPSSGIKRNKELSRDRFILPSEMPMFLRAVAMEENEIIRDYILISLFTGARRSNAIAMCWSELDLSDRLWRIQRTKNGLPQTIPLTDEALMILNERYKKRSSNYVFPGGGKRGHLAEPKKGWERILKRANCLSGMAYLRGLNLLDERTYNCLEHKLKDELDEVYCQLVNIGETKSLDSKLWTIEGLRIHDLRRTFGSWQAINGVSLSIIGRSLNHISPNSTAVYARLNIDPVREATSQATLAMRLKTAVNEGPYIYH